MFDARFHQQPINHDFDGVVSSLVQRNVVFEIDQFAVNAQDKLTGALGRRLLTMIA